MELLEMRAEVLYAMAEPLTSVVNRLIVQENIASKEWDNLILSLHQIKKLLAELGAKSTIEQVKRILADITKDEPRLTAIGLAIHDLHVRIADDLRSHVVLVVPPEMQPYYEECKFPSESIKAFPSAVEDMTEAGKCFALARYTACVFHCSRVIECGLKVLVATIGMVKLKHDWGAQIGEIEKELERRYRAAGARTPEEQFFSEAASQIGHIKNAWRNPTMHIERRYNYEVARDVFNASCAFMRDLSTKLHE
jgi:HEPN domain-containing protein